MNPCSTTDILRSLFECQQRSLLLRLHECAARTDRLPAETSAALQTAIDEEREHVVWLSDLLSDRHEPAFSVLPEANTTSLHYVDVGHLWPRLIVNKKDLIRACEEAASELRQDAQADEVVQRILNRHRAHLAMLEHLPH